MLSRVAEALFWVGRYVERAEDTARLLDVQFHQVVEDPATDEAETCRVLAAVMGVNSDGDAETPQHIRETLEILGYQADNPSSIVGALLAARQNARGVRESLSADIWECLNTTHHELPLRIEAARAFGPAPFFSYVRQRAAMLQGHADATMSRDHGFDFLVLGRSVERVDMTARLLAATVSTPSPEDGWIATLRACSAHEAYLRTYQRGVEPQLVLEFLLLDRLFPRSVFHALVVGEQALTRLDPTAAQGRAGNDARRVIGRTRTDLEFLPADAVLQDLPKRLHDLQSAMSEVSDAVSSRFFGDSTTVGWSLEESRR
ncbi:MAG: alpha-E domain-containing protein [Pseudonocardiales bacterium]